MSPVTDRSFGLLIAYLLPGFAFIWLWGQDLPAVSSWLADSPGKAPTVGGFLYITLASIGVGLTLSTLRWAILDKLHHVTGLVPPDWSHLKNVAHLDAYRLVIDLHYRYYQFYGSTLLVFSLLLVSPPQGQFQKLFTSPADRLLLIAGVILFYLASRDALRKYYTRFVDFLDSQISPRKRTTPMTNGGHHDSIPSAQPTTKQPAAAVSDLAPTTKTAQTDTSDSKGAEQKPQPDSREDK